jgi:hypothetical protein
MTEIPESSLDYLILSKEQATAIQTYFKHQYVAGDDEALRLAINKIDRFVEQQDATAGE